MPRPSISMVLARPLARALEPSALAEFFAAADLTPQMLADSDARISPAQFCVAWAQAIRLSGDSTLALRIAELTPPGAFGVVEYVCRSTATLRDALIQWCRYLGILNDAVEVTLVDLAGERCALRVIVESEAPAPASHELCFAIVNAHVKSMLGQRFCPAEVCFAHPAAPAHLARHRAFFDGPVRFDAKHTELVFHTRDLDTPLTSADPDLLAILLPVADEKRGQSRPHLLLTDQVRRALRGALSQDDAQLDAVAKKLGLTGRSLQRRLKDEGTAFQEVRDDTRRELADRYLGEGKSFAEISFLLGFSEPSAFFRAFKRWTGITPFERRAHLIGG